MVVIPGPKEPKNIDIYLEPLLDDLKNYGPLGAQLYPIAICLSKEMCGITCAYSRVH